MNVLGTPNEVEIKEMKSSGEIFLP